MPGREAMNRRAWIAAATGTVIALLPFRSGAESAPQTITVYKDPNCGCCKSWVKHLSANGFAPVVHDRSDMDSFKDSLSIPANLRSCHTAVIGPFLIEGHVPASDIKRLVASGAKGTRGLAVPGMPSGSPGMENGRKDAYDVLAFSGDGKTRVFSRQ